MTLAVALSARSETRQYAPPRAAQHEAHIRAWWDRWDEMFGGVIEETIEVIEALADRGAPQFALTNMVTHTWPKVRAMAPALEHLHYALVSGEHGLVKPDPAIFHLLCEKVGMAPGSSCPSTTAGRTWKRRGRWGFTPTISPARRSDACFPFLPLFATGRAWAAPERLRRDSGSIATTV
ncbi:MAG TPA: HAD family hydrolase [Caulobacteraceae bacterium]